MFTIFSGKWVIHKERTLHFLAHEFTLNKRQEPRNVNCALRNRASVHTRRDLPELSVGAVDILVYNTILLPVDAEDVAKPIYLSAGPVEGSTIWVPPSRALAACVCVGIEISIRKDAIWRLAASETVKITRISRWWL
jgi:hypothetical protein